MFAVLCALASSLLYAFASVLQQRGAEAQPEEHSLKLSLLVRLARNPAWIAGLACDVGGYATQFLALGHGPLVVVQPLLVCGLLFALPISARWARRRLHPADWSGAVLVCVGLGVFLGVSDPSSGRSNAHPVVWILLLAVDAGVTFLLIGASLTMDARRRAVLLSGAAGVLYGAAAALTKTSSHLLSHGVIHVVDHWQPYVLVVAGVGGMVLAQSAFQAGTLDVSLPTMSVVDPVVSILIGITAFHEMIRSSPGAIVLEVGSLAVMSIGVFMLARVEASID